MDVDSYLAQLNEKKGKLERWETDIFQLFHAGVSYQNIAEFLRLNGAECNKMEVYRFIHRKKRRHLLVATPEVRRPNESATKTEVVTTAPSPQPTQAYEITSDEAPSRPRFRFRDSLGKDKPKW